MKISIIVPAYNEEKLLGGALDSILSAASAFTRRGWETEVVVCDNNSTDGTARVAAEKGARVVFEPVNQIARARNTGARGASGDWLVFIDADSYPTAELFDDVAEAILTGRYLGGGCCVTMDCPFLGARMAMRLWNSTSRIMKWAAGSFIFCEKEAFWAVDGFDLQWYASEEIDFSKRIKRYGKRRGEKFVILHQHPLMTSSRKVHLYGSRDFLKLLFGFLTQGRGALKKTSTLKIWYDGKR